MAVVTYQCTVCQRQVDLVQNQQGLEWIGHCNITLGCRGTLTQIEVKPDYVRGVPTPDVLGLKNWVQRKVLFNFTQAVPMTQWVINHDLGTAPSVVVYVNQPTTQNPDNQVQILPEDINYNTDDQLTLIFPTAYSGTAQCIARSSNPDLLSPRPQPAPVTTPLTMQLSNNGILTIATQVLTVGNPTNISLTLAYTLGSNASSTDITYTASNVPNNNSPWEDTSAVVIKGKTYTIRTFNVQTSQTVSGQVANNSWAQLLTINSSANPFNIPMVNYATAPTTQTFIVDGDYSLYFENNAVFQTANTGTFANNIPWVASGSVYDPVTNETTIAVSNTISGTFANTSVIVCSGIRAINPGEVLILLGTTPFSIFDKVTNAYIDFTAVDNVADQFDIFYNGGDLFAYTAIETSVYPPIRSVN